MKCQFLHIKWILQPLNKLTLFSAWTQTPKQIMFYQYWHYWWQPSLSTERIWEQNYKHSDINKLILKFFRFTSTSFFLRKGISFQSHLQFMLIKGIICLNYDSLWFYIKTKIEIWSVFGLYLIKAKIFWRGRKG